MDQLAKRGAERLLALLGAEPLRAFGSADHPALAWRRSGLMAITGNRDGPGLVCPVPLATAADAALLALQAIAPERAVLPANGALLLGERARLLGLGRQGRISPNGSCRLIASSDGRIALNLVREDDWELMPILLGVERVDGWQAVEQAAAQRTTSELLDLGIELGLPIARDCIPAIPATPLTIATEGAAQGPPSRSPLVLDLSALWAGPLAASLLGMLGAEVIKVESLHRPDGARRGHRGFFDLLNFGKRSVSIDFSAPDQLARLQTLVRGADIVIESSRPRALQRLGIDREAFTARGGVWVAITAHDDPERVGFGDDAAAEGGVAAQMERGWGEPLFAGDAIADPLTGLHAALAAWALWQQGRAGLAKLSLAGTAAFAGSLGIAGAEELRHWQALAERDQAPLYPLRSAAIPARQSGADNALLG